MILALDLARQTGWAVGVPRGQPTYGTFKLDAARDETRFLQVVRRVRDLISAHGVTEVVFEQPFIGTRMAQSALMPLFGYRASAMIAAENAGLPISSVTPSTWRKHFVGTGGGKRAEVKAGVLDKCRWRGWNPRTEDEADALGLWDYRCAVLDPQHLAMGWRRG